MEYAIVKTGGKQYKVSQGSVLEVDRLNSQKDKEIILDNVLLWVCDGQVKIGKPYLSNVKIKTRVIDNIKGDKIRVKGHTTDFEQKIASIQIQHKDIEKPYMEVLARKIGWDLEFFEILL